MGFVADAVHKTGDVGGKKSAPPPPDFTGAAREQGNAARDIAHETVGANRPDQSTPWATSDWTKDANGNWTQDVQFKGPWAGLSGGLQQQAAANLSKPMDWSQFGTPGTGDSARNQAIDAAYGQATSRLDPMWQQREQQARSQLMNEGLDPSSDAYRTAMGDMGRQRNDAYTSAMNMAIGQGTAAGDSVFRNNIMAQQNAIANALRQRNQPMEEMQQMQGFLGMPGFQNASPYAPPNWLQAAGMQNDANYNAWQGGNQAKSDFWSGLMQLAGQVGTAAALSDETAKQNIRRLPVEALPGVPFATWEWRPGFEGSGPTFGVIAQDLERAAPQYVSRRPDGLRVVDYSFLQR